ncbi:tyrosine-type recombinase/integrase [Pseudomonas protegens]|nr:tyrosine-type recombinase/integrase [Pseudomonas protegens]
MLLQRFLTSHLAGLRGASPNTITSYRDTFKLLIIYLRDQNGIPPEKLSLNRVNVETITGFLNWLESNRQNSVSTRNQRLAAISSFYTWVQSQEPALMARCQDIMAIPIKKGAQACVYHLTVEQTRCLLKTPDRTTRSGRRDATLLATLYDTGARVQELVDLTVRNVRLQKPAVITLTGKGRKTRHVPLGANTATLLANYLTEFRLDMSGRDSYPLFFNQQHTKLSRGGVTWIIK